MGVLALAPPVPLRHQPRLRHAPAAHRPARRQPRPPRSARRRILRIFSEAAPEAPRASPKLKRSDGRGQRNRAGQPGPGPHHASAGETSRRRAHHFQPPGFSRRHGHRALARSRDSPARRFRQIHRQPTGWPCAARTADAAISASRKAPKPSTKRSGPQNALSPKVTSR